MPLTVLEPETAVVNRRQKSLPYGIYIILEVECVAQGLN